MIKNDLVYEMIKRIHNFDVKFDYVLMDSWYSFPASFDEIKTNSVDLIGKAKKLSSKIAFIFNRKKISIPGLYKVAMKQKYRRFMADVGFPGIFKHNYGSDRKRNKAKNSVCRKQELS